MSDSRFGWFRRAWRRRLKPERYPAGAHKEPPTAADRSVPWRANPATLAEAVAIVTDPRFRRMMTVALNEGPWSVCLPLDADSLARVVVQARTEGYMEALNTLLSLASPIGQTEPDLEEDWGVKH